MATKPICKIDGCDKASRSRGMCHMHYDRFRRGRDLHAPSRAARGECREWLFGKAKFLSDECLIWPFYRDEKGYARITIGGSNLYASRVMCEIVYGAPSGDDWTLHTCGNGHLGCVNPRHLRWGTARQNLDDRDRHGRTAKGEDIGNSKLTEETVRKIKAIAEFRSAASIADDLGVSASCVQKVIRRETWRHVR